MGNWQAGVAHSEYPLSEASAVSESSVPAPHWCVTKIYANVRLHMLIPHIYIKLNRLLHCFLTPASIHDYLF